MSAVRRFGHFMSTLYVVATPIGNLEDISLRALKTLREVALIATEDTRTTARLLKRYEIETPMTSYFEHNKLSKLDYIMGCLESKDVAIVSEAGTPGINDPGYELVVEAARRGFKVVPIPGPSSVISALAVSGLPTDRFTYLGFLPRRTAARTETLKSVSKENGTLILLEAPHRLLETLDDAVKILGNRRIAVCRELTKMHEETFRGTISDAIGHFTNPRGEFTLVIEGDTGVKETPVVDVAARMSEMKRTGVRGKDAVASLALETGISKKELYRAWLKQA
jgi:16S rRNA (cytidine1402-2'-O)-methyltransferase